MIDSRGGSVLSIYVSWCGYVYLSVIGRIIVRCLGRIIDS